MITMLKETFGDLGQLENDMWCQYGHPHRKQTCSWWRHMRVCIWWSTASTYPSIFALFSEHFVQFLALTNTFIWLEHVTALTAFLNGGSPYLSQENRISTWKCTIQVLEVARTAPITYNNVNYWELNYEFPSEEFIMVLFLCFRKLIFFWYMARIFDLESWHLSTDYSFESFSLGHLTSSQQNDAYL